MAGRLVLRIRLRFHNHPPQQLTIALPFHQKAANQLRSDYFCRAAEEGVGQCWQVLSGYGSGLKPP